MSSSSHTELVKSFQLVHGRDSHIMLFQLFTASGPIGCDSSGDLLDSQPPEVEANITPAAAAPLNYSVTLNRQTSQTESLADEFIKL